jgi:hypothetical protein
VGLGLGLLYTWVISPVKYVDTRPATLRADYRAEYLQLVARAWRVDGDVERARARLAALDVNDAAQAVTAFSQQIAAAGGDAETLAALASLASALEAGPASPSQIPPPTPARAPTGAPATPPRAQPTRFPTATAIPAFAANGQAQVCDAAQTAPLIEVVTLDRNGKPVPGVEIVVEWASGQEHFFTGLKPELGAGYGDFVMAADQRYAVHPANSPNATVTGLRIPECPDGSRGSWRLVFQQP